MNILSVENISKSFGEKVILDNVTFGITQGEKIALVGTNGVGKSTFLNIIASENPPNDGNVALHKGKTLAFLSQNPYFDEDLTVWETIFFTENAKIQAIKEYEKALESGDDNLLNESLVKMGELDAWEYEHKIKEVLGKLGIHDTNLKVAALSGGQRKRLALAKVLLQDADLIILDEPTNHLDLEVIEWLEKYLSTENLTLLMVTHDRYFLDQVTNSILELDNCKLHKYQGNYAYFVEKKAEREEVLRVEVEKARNLYKKELEWVRRMPKARGTKAKYRMDAFKDIKKKAKTNLTKQGVEINVKTSRQGKKILELANISKAFGDKKLFENFSHVFQRGEKIGIIGKNGAGKSTFLNIITQKLKADSGEIILGQNTKFGYYNQKEANYPQDMRVIDVIQRHTEVVRLGSGKTITVSQFLNHFNFAYKRQYEYAYKLSGGEKRRLQLMEVLLTEPNFLILDEPTNDLDIETLSVLEEFLKAFDGCLMVVSHDRCFMDNLVEHIFAFEGDQKITDFPGNYTDYREYQKEVESEKRKEEKLNQELKEKTQRPAEKEKTKLSYKEKMEFETIEADIEKLEMEKEEFIEKLNSGESDHEKLMEWSSEIERLKKAIDEKEERWIYLSEFA